MIFILAHIDDCMAKSDVVSRKTSLSSIMA